MKEYKLTEKEKEYYNTLVEYVQCNDEDKKDNLETEIAILKNKITNKSDLMIVHYMIKLCGLNLGEEKSFFGLLNCLVDVDKLERV